MFMKILRVLFRLLIGFIFLISFIACEKEDSKSDRIWDFNPIVFYFTLIGENGEDLLDPTTPGSYAGMKINATYQNETYVKDVSSKAYLAIMYGLRSIQLRNGQYALTFGELDGADTYKNETIILDWGDGTQDVVTFSSELKWKKHEPVFNRSYKLNGVEVEEFTSSPIIQIRK